MPTEPRTQVAKAPGLGKVFPFAVPGFLFIFAMLVVFRNHGAYVFPLDDPYITLHNAKALLEGFDPNFPQVSPLAGATSGIHLALVTLLSAIFPAAPAAFWLTVTFAAIFAAGVYVLAMRMRNCVFLAALISLAAVVTGHTLFHLMNGLETGVMMAATIWAIILAIDPKPGLRLPFLCGLLPFIRPEGMALSICLMAHQVLLRREQKTVRSEKIKRVALDIGLAVLAALPWLVWYLWETGSFVPLTAGAKSYFFREAGSSFFHNLGFAAVFLLAAGFWPFFTGLPGLAFSRLGRLLLVFFGVFLLAFATFFPTGLLHNHFRYAYLLLPPLIYGFLTLPLPLRFLKVGGVVLTGTVLLSYPGFLETYLKDLDFTRNQSAPLVEWLGANVDPGAPILVHDIGYVSFSTDYRLLDLVGLKSTVAANFHQERAAYSATKDRAWAVHRYALTARPEYAVILDKRFWRDIAGDLELYGWTLALVRDHEGEEGYQVFRMTEPKSPGGRENLGGPR